MSRNPSGVDIEIRFLNWFEDSEKGCKRYFSCCFGKLLILDPGSLQSEEPCRVEPGFGETLTLKALQCAVSLMHKKSHRKLWFSAAEDMVVDIGHCYFLGFSENVWKVTIFVTQKKVRNSSRPWRRTLNGGCPHMVIPTAELVIPTD